MNIDVTALELLPEIQTADGLKPCRRPTRVMWCVKPTCVETGGRNTVIWHTPPGGS